jgi:hypothetical protein
MKKILVIAVALMSVVNTVIAQHELPTGLVILPPDKSSPWKEVQVVEIPAGQPIHAGVTKNGNPKFWFEFGEIKVNVSPGSAVKYKANQVTLLLVKWQHSETGKYKYSTRQKSAAKKSTPNVDLNNLFN